MPLSASQKSALAILFKSKPKTRQLLLRKADKDLVCTICECVHNLLKGNIQITDALKKKLAKRKGVLRSIVKKRGSWKIKKKVIQRGGNPLLAVLAPVVATILRAVW
jgi:hypothetical protein